MKHRLLLLILLPLAACADHPDPTTTAIATADLAGGVCTQEIAPLFTQSGNLIENYDCEDRSFRQISGLVFNTNQE